MSVTQTASLARDARSYRASARTNQETKDLEPIYCGRVYADDSSIKGLETTSSASSHVWLCEIHSWLVYW